MAKWHVTKTRRQTKRQQVQVRLTTTVLLWNKVNLIIIPNLVIGHSILSSMFHHLPKFSEARQTEELHQTSI